MAVYFIPARGRYKRCEWSKPVLHVQVGLEVLAYMQEGHIEDGDILLLLLFPVPRTEPLIAVVLGAECKESVNVEPTASLDNCATDQTTLAEANDVDLLVCEIWVVVQPLANLADLPVYVVDPIRNQAIANPNALDKTFVSDDILDVSNLLLPFERGTRFIHV